MKRAILPVVLVLVLIGGCAGLSSEQIARIDALSAENQKATSEMSVLLSKAKAGTITPLEVVQAMDRLRALIDSNVKEIKEIEATASKGSVIAGAIGLFGRTALHAVSIAVPGSGPIAAALQGLLTLLLGGSSTKKQDPTKTA